jgi:hypothetical protein
LDYLRALGRPNIDDVMKPDPDENPPKPLDPASEYGQVMKGNPIVAGPAQNHMAHIDAHTAQMQGLQTSNLPVEQGEAAMAILAAHIAEHYAMDTMVKVSAAVGIPLEQFQQGLPPEIEAQIAPQIAAAIQQIEAERAPPQEQEESKTEVEMVKGQNAQALETMKATHAKELETMKARHAQELQKQRDDAEMERSIQDDETAIEIASMPDRNSAPTRAGGVSR